MKREILFRGKRKDNGDWVEGFYEPYKNKEGCYIGEHKTNSTLIPKLHAVYPETVGQYTGLRDKRGKAIYEGDIVRHYNSIIDLQRFIIAKICWDGEECRFVCDTSKGYNAVWNGCLYEVIGNIHDNPEMLRGEEND